MSGPIVKPAQATVLLPNWNFSGHWMIVPHQGQVVGGLDEGLLHVSEYRRESSTHLFLFSTSAVTLPNL